jgi:hypothetical protein
MLSSFLGFQVSRLGLQAIEFSNTCRTTCYNLSILLLETETVHKLCIEALAPSSSATYLE